MSVLLNKSNRILILERALKDRFDKEEEALHRDEYDISMEVYERLVSQELRAQLSAVPKKWICYTSTFTVNVGGYVFRHKLRHDMPFPILHYYNTYYLLGHIDDRALQEKEIALRDRRETLMVAKERAHQALRVIIWGVRSTKSLFEAWPDGFEYYKDIATPAVKAGVPAVQVQAVNAMLGLPKDVAA